MIQKKSEDAVSPVIGVMLLLVVTIIIAAVVAVFASGVGTDAEPAPATVLNVVDICDRGYSDPNVDYLFDPMLSVIEGYGGTDNGDGTYTLGGHTFKQDDNWNWVTTDGEHLFESFTHGPYYDTSKPKDEWKEWLDQYSIEIFGGIKDVTVTITSVSGDTLDLKKLSVKVYNSDGKLVAEKHQNSGSGTISPGDTEILVLDELIDEENANYNIVNAGEKVEVFILYGEHVIVSKELKVSDGGEY